MAITHVVRKTFPAKGGKLIAGQCVDPSSWRWAHKLENQRTILPLTDSDIPVQAGDGTWWENERLARARDVKNGVKSSDRSLVEDEPEQLDPSLYPEKVARGKYRLSDGEIFQGNRKSAVAFEAALHN